MDQTPYQRYCKVSSPKQVKRKRFGSINDDKNNNLSLIKDLNFSYFGNQFGNGVSESRNQAVSTACSYQFRDKMGQRPSTSFQVHSRQQSRDSKSIQKMVNNHKRTASQTLNNSIQVTDYSPQKNKSIIQTEKANTSTLLYTDFDNNYNNSIDKSLLHRIMGSDGKIQKQISVASSAQKGLGNQVLSSQKQLPYHHQRNQSQIINPLSCIKQKSYLKQFEVTQSASDEKSQKTLQQNHNASTLLNSRQLNQNDPSKMFLFRKSANKRNSTLIWNTDSQTMKLQMQVNQKSMDIRDINRSTQKFDRQNSKVDALTKLKRENNLDDYNLKNLAQIVPQYSEFQDSQVQVEYHPKTFNAFKEECCQDLNIKGFIQYSGEIVMGKKVGKGGLLNADGDFYYGHWQQDQKHGFGITIFKNGKVYKGYWRQDAFNGQGILKNLKGDIIYGTFEDGSVKDDVAQIHYNNGEWYVGKLEKEIRQGQGTYAYNNGDQYVGQWKNGLKDGEGEMKFKNGSSFKGSFQKDQFYKGIYKDEMGNLFKVLQHETDSKLDGYFKKGRMFGFGRIDFSNKDVYVGFLKDGKRSGQGKMIYHQYNTFLRCSETAEYDGQWKFNYRHGKGTMAWADGSKFIGDWQMDKRYYGIMHMFDETVYEGFFKDEQLHGKGKLTFKDMRVYQGQFENGKSLKFGRLSYPNGEIYTGEMIEYQKNGIGIILLPSGNIYEGTFTEDYVRGFGTIIYSNGDRYIGDVYDFKKIGQGRMTYKASQETYEGSFMDDMRNGHGYLKLKDGRVYCGEFARDIENGIGEYLFEKDMRDVKEIDLISNRFAEIQNVLFNGCKKLGFEYRQTFCKIVL